MTDEPKTIQNDVIEDVIGILLKIKADGTYDAADKVDDVEDLLEGSAGKVNPIFVNEMEGVKNPSVYDLSVEDSPETIKDLRGFVDLFTLGHNFSEEQKTEIENAIAQALDKSPESAKETNVTPAEISAENTNQPASAQR